MLSVFNIAEVVSLQLVIFLQSLPFKFEHVHFPSTKIILNLLNLPRSMVPKNQSGKGVRY